jgi:stage V sporulation protein R
LREEQQRQRDRRLHDEQIFNDLWRTVPSGPGKRPSDLTLERRKALLQLPQENILYFLEKSAPRLQAWQRELLRIVRLVAQYFYPQGQTKVMNEGTATFVHYKIMTYLREAGRLSEGNFFEFLQSHTNVVFQPTYDDPRYSGFNPYALGFAMMQDIERIVTDPEEEDRAWFPEIAGTGDAMSVLRHIWANYRDESFIGQFLSPRLMRQLRLFHLHDRSIRRALARQHDVGWVDANIEIVDADLAGDRRLVLHHTVVNRNVLDETDTRRILQHLADLWGYDVVLKEIYSAVVLKEHVVSPRAGGFAPH